MRGMDIFCQVIDNFGDVGVVYRLATQLKNRYKIRVFIDSLKELALLNPKVNTEKEIQEVEGIEFVNYDYLEKNWESITPREVIIEAFGCKIQEGYYNRAKEESKLLINLEYLSSEEWTAGFHGVESPTGAKTLKKYFYIPGLRSETGGVLFQKEKIERVKNLYQDEKNIKLDRYMKNFPREFREGKRIGTVFSYEKNFGNLFETLNSQKEETILLIMGEKSQNSVKEVLTKLREKKVEEIDEERDRAKTKDENFNLANYKKIHIEYYPFISQEEYDELIMLTDFNFVRGEDSFVRALLSGIPFLWHIYFQEEGVHMEKLRGFLQVLREYFTRLSLKEFPEEFKIKYLKLIDEYEKLMCEYNERDGNNLEIGLEDYKSFFNNLSELKKMMEQYSNYILKNHDLIEKLNRFIEQKMI